MLLVPPVASDRQEAVGPPADWARAGQEVVGPIGLVAEAVVDSPALGEDGKKFERKN